jgi:hypothetical protein
MSLKQLIIILTLPSFLAGCSAFYGSQSPAPVYGGSTNTHKPSARTHTKSKLPSSDTKDIVTTQALPDFSSIKTEALPALEPIPLPPAISEPASAGMSAPMSPPSVATKIQDSSPLPIAPEVQGSPAPPPPELTPFEPIESTVHLSPAVNALVTAAIQNSKAGDLDLASASIERAIRIEPRNATLFYKLSVLRLKQNKPRLAEDLAKKSALLADSDNLLKKNCWLLIAHAREMQQDYTGAKAAKTKADNL